MKRICFLNGDMSRSGGTERVTAMIANELSKKNYEVHVLNVTNESMSSFFELEDTVYHDRILRQKTVNLKKDYFKVVNGIRKYIKKQSIDVLIEVDVICNLYTIPATRFLKTKIISWEHFNYYSNNGSKLRDISRKLTKYFSNHIVTLTEQDRQNYIQKLDVSDKMITGIYNPIQSVKVSSCNLDSKQILSVGQLRHIKGFDLLCEVAKDILHQHPDWTWLIVGEGEDRLLIEQKIKEYRLEGLLILEGNQKEMDPYYRNSSLYVMTSRNEGLPMTLLEAKSYQLPIVSFDCQTGPSEIVEDGVNGYLIEENNCEQMSLKLNSLLEDSIKLQMFSQSAKNNIHKFELNEVINKWEEIINRL